MAIPRDGQRKGFKNCPVCGCRYQGELSKHLDDVVRGSEGVTRCDWRLMEARIFRTVTKLSDSGWKLAGSNGAKTAVLLAKTHPHLAMHTTSGSTQTKVYKAFLDPANDMKAWWIRRWAYPLSLVSGWSLRMRAQIIGELEGRQDLVDAVEATYRIGGPEALKGLVGGPIAERCDSVLGNPVDAVIGRGHTRLFDRCILAKGHSEGVPHRGARTSITWGPGFVTTVGMGDVMMGPEPDESEIDLEGLFAPSPADEW